MTVTIIRTIIIFTTLFIIMRLMGKRQIGEMQPYEFIITLIIADLACVPMSDVSIPITYGIVSILMLFVLHQLLSIIETGGDFFKIVISGKPSVVINKNGVDMKELKKNNMGIEDLIESMRGMGYFSLDDLDYAIFESNGKLSALENENSKSKSIPLLLVNEGKAVEKNLMLSKIDYTRLNNIISGQNQNLKSTEVMTVDGNGKVYFKAKKEKFKTFGITLPEGVKW